MQVSVLTPSYNYARFLPDALASVAGQRDPPPQHVVVDGASSDGTVEVLRHAPAHVLWRSAPDDGQSDALNKALALASGDWIGWLNADEFYLPGALDALARCAAIHADAAVIHGDAAFVDVDGRFLRLVAQHSFSLRVLRWNRCNISSCAMFVRRDALPERGWDVGLRATMDWDLYLEVARGGGRFVYVPRPMGCFRVHPAQVTFERLPASHPDFARLAERHRRPSGWRAAPANRAGELEHRARKLTEGGFARELKVRGLRGADLRWFDSPGAEANAAALVARGSAGVGGMLARRAARAGRVCPPR